MTPYYSDSGITIYHADSLSIMSGLDASVTVTDPPLARDRD